VTWRLPLAGEGLPSSPIAAKAGRKEKRFADRSQAGPDGRRAHDHRGRAWTGDREGSGRPPAPPPAPGTWPGAGRVPAQCHGV